MAATNEVLDELSKDILSNCISKDALIEAVLKDGGIRFNSVEMTAVG